MDATNKPTCKHGPHAVPGRSRRPRHSLTLHEVFSHKGEKKATGFSSCLQTKRPSGEIRHGFCPFLCDGVFFLLQASGGVMDKSSGLDA